MSQSWMFGVACIVSAAAYDILEFGTWNTASNCAGLASSATTHIAGVCTSTGKYECTATEMKVYASQNNCGILAFTYTFGQCTSAAPYQKATKHSSIDNYYIKLSDVQTPPTITYYASGHCTILGAMSAKWTRVSNTSVRYDNWAASQSCSGNPSSTLTGDPAQPSTWLSGAYSAVEVMTAGAANMCSGAAAATTTTTTVASTTSTTTTVASTTSTTVTACSWANCTTTTIDPPATAASIIPRVTVATLAPALFMALWSLR